MSKFIFIGLFAATLWVSCTCTYQYDVYVSNKTTEPIRVAYKTLHDVRGEVEETIELAPGAQKRIIQTTDLNPGEGCRGTMAKDCALVAVYVRAFLRDSIPSKKAWCGEGVLFQKTDIQQAEFIIQYKPTDF